MFKSLLNKVAGGKADVFCEYCEISKSTYLQEHLHMAASEVNLGSDCLGLSFRTVTFKHPDLVISQKYQSLSNQSLKHNSAPIPSFNLTLPNFFWTYNQFHNVLRLSMFYQIFLSPQVKQRAIITYKHGIYELPRELPNDLRLGILGN